MDDKLIEQAVFEQWTDSFDERQLGLIRSCRQYAADGAPGLPGHQLMLITAKMAALLDARDIAHSVMRKPSTDGD